MYYKNTLTLTTESNDIATKALEIMKKRLERGFECDNLYRHNASAKMAEDLLVSDNTITLPAECGYYDPEDAKVVFTEIVKELAASLNEEKFTCYVYNDSDYEESVVEASFLGETLELEISYTPFV